MSDIRLFLHTSNRIEVLAAALGRMVDRVNSGGDPFRTVSVTVQNQGMGRWLALRLADHRGVCFNTAFPFTLDLIGELLGVLLPEEGKWGFAREEMVWAVYRLLGEFGADPRFAEIGHYLADGDQLKRFQLADRLADLFDRYQVYRPELLLEWEGMEEPEDWQAVLWKKTVAAAPSGRMHLGRVWEMLEEGPGQLDEERRKRLPPEVFIFGVTSLPPLFLRVLRAYGCFGEVHLFLLQPTELYWGDVRSKREQVRFGEGVAEPDPLEEGHPLLASLGRQGRDFQNLLLDFGFQPDVGGEDFEDPGADSVLRVLQRDILFLHNRTGDDRIVLGREDRSIEIHSCHSPLREAEVLYDQLLDRFEEDPTLLPRDVLVMVPDIDLYAPYIEAVFGCVEDPKRRIPFSVVDRRPRTEFHAIDVWFQLLELAGSRFGARDLVSLLETVPMRERFQLSERDVAVFRQWVETTGIRWGIDAEHRGSRGLPSLHLTTWKSGIEQWLLGYAMSEEGEKEWREIFPYGEVEGGNLPLLDRFLEALDVLFHVRRELSDARTVGEWCESLSDLLHFVFGGVEQVAVETERLRIAIEAVAGEAAVGGNEEEVPLEVMRYLLERRVDGLVSGGRFLAGGVTFCALQPMRTVPARVIALMGMDDAAFPRNPQKAGFDRMRDERRAGDRSPREDDRFLFLETILSARDQLIISYVGQSPHDLTDSPPSVLVAELIDHLNQICVTESGCEKFVFPVRRHPLQPFHRSYFLPGPLFSYSEENARAGRRLAEEGGGEVSEFISGPLAKGPEESFRNVGIVQLIRFFRNPAKFLLQERLGIRLPEAEDEVGETELFSLDNLQSYHLKHLAVQRYLEGAGEIDFRRFQARGRAPLGRLGKVLCRDAGSDAEKFAKRVKGVLGNGAVAENRRVEKEIGSFRLSGTIGPFFGGRLVVFRPAKLKGKDYLAAWIQHLAGSCHEEELVSTILIGEERSLTLAPVSDARERLEQLLEIYWEGLRRPVPFFPDSGYLWYVKAAGGEPEKAIAEALKNFTVTEHSRGERDDEYIRICWGERESEEILDDLFEETVKKVFEGMIEAEIVEEVAHG